jgi:hypothetical protein
MNKRATATLGITLAIFGILGMLVLVYFMGRDAGAFERAHREHRTYHAVAAPMLFLPVTIAITFVGLTVFFVAHRKTQ